MFPELARETEATTQRTWRVSLTIPKTPEEPHQWNRNRTFLVACETFEQAVAAARGSYPDATIWGVVHGEKIVILKA